MLPPPTSAEAVRALWMADLPHSAKHTLQALASHLGDRGGEVWPSIRRLARMTTLAPSTVQRALDWLEAAQVLTIQRANSYAEHARHQSSRYTIHWEHVAELPAADPRDELSQLRADLYALRAHPLYSQQATPCAQSEPTLYAPEADPVRVASTEGKAEATTEPKAPAPWRGASLFEMRRLYRRGVAIPAALADKLNPNELLFVRGGPAPKADPARVFTGAELPRSTAAHAPQRLAARRR